MNKMTHTRSAYSLIFAFIIMTLIMVIASTSIQDTRAKLQLFRDLEASSQARLAAESSAELGIVALKNSSFSAESATESFCLESEDRSDCQSSGSYTIYPYAQENEDEGDGNFYLPIPGTGNAAPTEDCSILETHQDIDHSCNWNKLSVGESMTVPMFYDDGSGTLSFPGDTAMNLQGWYLRMRTPCSNGSIAEDCDGGSRYTISSKSASTFMQSSDNPSLVLWEFVGETSSGSTNILPDDLTSGSNRHVQINTEIYEGLVNYSPWTSTSGYTNTVLVAKNSSTLTGFDSIYDFLRLTGYTNLYFSMSINNILEVPSSGETIPYLEYQIVMDANAPVMANTAEIMGEGYYDTGDKTYYFPYVISTTNTEEVTTLYTLSN